MNRRSLRLRLGIFGGLAILATLALSVVGLALLFDRHLERVAVADLKARSHSVAAMIEPTGAYPALLRAPPVDPMYEQPFSGHYWQLELGDTLRKSRSLWDVVLPRIGSAMPSGTERVIEIAGPRGEPLLAFETWLSVGTSAARTQVRIVVATNRALLTSAREGFVRDLLPYSLALALLLVLAFWTQLTLGIRPLMAVSARVTALRAGLIPRMGGELPAEVMPLAREIDTLLTDRDEELKRARNRAGDLAHGLKTPLQALLGDAAQLRDKGEIEIANGLDSIASSMQGLVERELRRARLRSDRLSLAANLRTVADGVVNVLRRTPTGAALSWDMAIPADLTLRIDPDDLAEAIGAIAENATRHAVARVTLRATAEGDKARIVMSDDGPGVPSDALEKLVARGFRLDERADGQGFGLAIVGEIVAAAEGSIALVNGGPGLTVTLLLPLAPLPLGAAH